MLLHLNCSFPLQSKFRFSIKVYKRWFLRQLSDYFFNHANCSFDPEIENLPPLYIFAKYILSVEQDIWRVKYLVLLHLNCSFPLQSKFWFSIKVYKRWFPRQLSDYFFDHANCGFNSEIENLPTLYSTTYLPIFFFLNVEQDICMTSEQSERVKYLVLLHLNCSFSLRSKFWYSIKVYRSSFSTKLC